MTRHTLWWLLALALLTSPVLLARPAWGADEAASQELQGTIDKYIAAYNEGSVDKVRDFWTEDSDFVDIRGRFHQGRDLIMALFRRGFANNPGRKLTMTSDLRKFLASGVAMDDGILQLTGADGEVDRGRFSVVWTKVDGRWRIRSARDIPLEEEPAAEQPEAPPLEELAWLVGKWEAQSDKHQITLDCDWQLNKSFLVQKIHKKGADEEFDVVTWIAYDPSAGNFHSWYFDSRGGFGGGPWSKRDEQWRTAVVAVLPDGQTGSSQMTWQKLDERTLQWQAIDREVEGESVPDAQQKYVRVKAN
jgi:uncharacterized protein (TIGR02246 family)